MKRSKLIKHLAFLPWAVLQECEAKNDGKIEKYKEVIALFNYPFHAEDYIKNCLPKENRDKFSIERIQ